MVLFSHFSILLFGSPMPVHRDGFIKVIVSISLLPLLTYLFECSLPASANIQGAGGASEKPPANFAMVDMCLSGNIQGFTINDHTSEYHFTSLVPRSPFCCSVCVQYNTRKRKSVFHYSSASIPVYHTQKQKLGRPGNEATISVGSVLKMTCSG